MNLEKHRDSLIKYCYDLSKIIATVAVINQFVSKCAKTLEIITGILVSLLSLLFAMVLEEGGDSK